MANDEPNWCEDESFWERTFPFMFSEAGFAAAIENVPKLVALSGVAGGTVLDLACGPGRYAVPLAKAGFAVTGVDRTRFLLDKARQHADREAATIEWIERDMREFVRPEAFDLAINLFTSFGYFDDWAENRQALENVLASLKPGGVFIFDHLGKELLAERFTATRSERWKMERPSSIATGSSTIGRGSKGIGFCSKAIGPRRFASAIGSTRAGSCASF